MADDTTSSAHHVTDYTENTPPVPTPIVSAPYTESKAEPDPPAADANTESEPAPVVVAGQAVWDDGSPVTTRKLLIQRGIKGGFGEVGGDLEGLVTDSTGHSTIRGRIGAGDDVLRVSIPTSAHTPPYIGTPFKVGDADLLVVLQRRGDIRGQLVLPDGINVGDFQVTNRRAAGLPFGARPSDDGSFALKDLPLIAQDVVIRATGSMAKPLRA